eukprot:1118166-Amphidinium_carterae.1
MLSTRCKWQKGLKNLGEQRALSGVRAHLPSLVSKQECWNDLEWVSLGSQVGQNKELTITACANQAKQMKSE